jgi:PAS domain S-box-containing protein
MKTPSSSASFPWFLSGFFLFLILTIIGLGYYYFMTQREEIKQKKHEELSAIAELKVGQITQWREERFSDAKDIYENLIVTRQVEAFIKAPIERQRREELLAWLKSLKDHYFYSDVCLLDSNGSIRLSDHIQPASLDVNTQEQVRKVLKKREIFFSDLYLSEITSKSTIDLLVPLQRLNKKNNNVIGVILLRIDPSKLLFPVVQSWPMPSRTSETLLLERQGDSVMYLNELRHRKDPALTFRLPIADEKLPASMAVRGIEGTVEGSDYRGIPVLACIKKIPNSPWFMIAKTDQEEIYAPLRVQTFLIGLIVALLVFSVTAAFGFWWRHQRALYYRTQYEAEIERQALVKHFEYLIKYANDIIILTDENLNIREINNRALETYGYTREELLHLNAGILRTPETVKDLRERINTLDEHHGVRYETIHRRKNGTTFPIEASLRLIEIEGKKFYQAIIHDITERKKAEDAVRENEIIFSTFLEYSPVFVFFKDKKLRSLRLSRNFEHMLGIPIHQALGKTMDELFPSELAKKMVEDDLHIMKEGRLIKIVEELNGRIYETTKFPVLKDGEPYMLAGFTVDITERKRADEVLRATQEMLRIILDTIPVRVFWKDRSFNYLGSNIAFARDTGLNSPDDLVGKNDFEMTWAQQAELYRADDRKVMESGVPKVNYEESQTTPDGSTIWLRTSKIPLLDEKGKIYGVLGTYEEITERKQAEEALMQSNSFNEMLLQTMPFGMDIVDEQGNILFINDFMKKLLGTDAMGQRCWTMYKDNQKQCMDCPLHKGIEFGKAETLESTGVLGGMTFQISHIGMMYNGKKAMLEVFQDVTEQKKLQQELLQVQKMESIGTLAGGVAHDFNNILAIILAYTSAMERSALNKKKILEHCRTITQAVNRGAALVRQILTFARKTDIVLAPMSLADLINEIVSMLKQTFPKIISFKEVIDKDIPFINADRTQIHQAMLNLCVNARDAMPKGGCITIKAERQTIGQVQERVPAANQDSYICLSITDTGEGMMESTRRRIFDPFFTTKEQGKGTGLGLAVVYGVVRSHNAFIDVESAVGRGTTFRLYFPIPSLSEQMIDSSSAVESYTIGGTETILLVEDEEALIEMVRLILKSKGYKVFTAQDGNEAIKVYKLHKNEIDIVLTDMGLPEMTGLDMFKKLKEVNAKVKAIFASGYFEPDIKSEIMKAGAKGFVQKPYSQSEILRILRSVLDEKE